MQALASFWEMLTGANPNAIIAVFTIAIAGTTIVYTLVTWRLLRQSRWAFLVDTLVRITGHMEERTQQWVSQVMAMMSDVIKEEKLGIHAQIEWENLRVELETEPYRRSLSKAIGSVNKRLMTDLDKAFLDYLNARIEAEEYVRSELKSFTNKLRKKAPKKGKSKGV